MCPYIKYFVTHLIGNRTSCRAIQGSGVVTVGGLQKGPQIKENQAKTRKARKLNTHGKLGRECELK